MTSDSHIDDAKGAMQVVGDLLKAAGDDPNAKRAAANLGMAAVTVTGTLNTLLLPFAAINFGVERAKQYFTNRFANDLAERTATIPPENVVEPKMSIAAPAIQGLAYSHEESELRDLYLALLATAMDGRVSTRAHPSFVEVIKQLNAEEARILRTLPRGVFEAGNNIPVANIIIKADGAVGIQHAVRHLQPLTILGTETAAEHPDSTLAAENWARLGLIELRYDLSILVPGAYDWLETRPEVERLRASYPAPHNSISFERGILRSTEFGARFAKAVGIL